MHRDRRRRARAEHGDRIKAKAVAQGLATEAELATMNEREIHRFIFRAGFSTAAARSPRSPAAASAWMW
jgi:hypothetical protein